MPSVLSVADLSNELWRINSALKASTQEVLDVNAEYDRRGVKLEDQLTARVARYSDPASGRAKQIQGTAQRVAAAIKGFGNDRTTLITKLAFNRIDMNITVLGFAAEGAVPSLPAMAPSTAASATETARAFLQQLKTAQLHSVLRMSNAVAIGERV